MHIRQIVHNWATHVGEPIATEKDSGATLESLALLDRHLNTLGQVETVECLMPFGWDQSTSLVRFIGTGEHYIEVDGLSWGYGGTGPHGLHKALKMVGIEVPFDLIVGERRQHFILHRAGALDCPCLVIPEPLHQTDATQATLYRLPIGQYEVTLYRRETVASPVSTHRLISGPRRLHWVVHPNNIEVLDLGRP